MIEGYNEVTSQWRMRRAVPLVLHERIAADDFAAFVGTGYRTALVEILAEEKRIDFRCVPAQRNVLIAIRKDLGLNEMAG
jgi:hypothetical protein